MAYTAPAKDTVHFVGGLGTQADKSATNGGGVSKTAWDAGTASDFIGANGGPVTNDTNCTFTHATKNISKTGIGAGVTVGTLAYVSGTNITTGCYEVTTVTDDDNIICSGIDSTDNNADTTCNVGGAFDTLQNALDDDSTNAASYTRTILTNLAETISAQIDIDTGEGNRTNDTWKRIVGCDSGMSPLSRGNYVTIQSSGDVFEIENVNNFYMENIEMQPGAGFIGFDSEDDPTGNCHNQVLKNCKSTGGALAVYHDRNKKLVLVDCVFESDSSTVIHQASNANTLIMIGCTVKAASGQKPLNLLGAFNEPTAVILNCVFINGTIIDVAASQNVVMANCTFYNQTTDAVNLNGSNIFFIGYNNIFYLNDNASGIRAVEHSAGSIGFCDYNCAYSVNGALESPAFDFPSRANKNDNSIEVNPSFVDAANADFRPRNSSVLRGGLPDIDGNETQMGAVEQKYQFVNRAKMTNAGRLQIIR